MPIPNILQWSNIKDSMLEGIKYQKEITQMCSNSESSVPFYKVIPVNLDRDDALDVCEILQAKLAYPKTLTEYANWNGK